MREPIEIGEIIAEGTIDISDLKGSFTLEEPTAFLKYIDNVLYQKWRVTDNDRNVINVHEEWRPIPHENDNT